NANVDMTSVTGWYGIGRDNDPSKSEEEIIHPFTGHFDGQNHTVYANPDFALFGAVRTDNDTIAVRNLNLYGYTHYSPLAFALRSGIIENCNFSGTVETSGIPASSGLISFVFGGTVRNCTVTADISAVSGSAGGIAAFLNGGTITGCTLASGSKINVSESAGTSGAVRGADDTNSTGYAGGIAGVADSGTISDCIVAEDVEITASHNAGGVAGKISQNCNVSGNNWPSQYSESGTGGSVNGLSSSSGCNAGFGVMGGSALILAVSFIAGKLLRKKR
ncbi:MAG: hypothetical protein IJ697_09360, partial [Synergistaceae bacterium]|nr:hypothetical protein [Synergistaceae bacterium]